MTIYYLPTEPTMHTQEWPPRRPYIPKGCDQQGRVEDGQRAPAPAEAATDVGATGEFGPRPQSVARWAAVAFGGVVLLIVALGVIALAVKLSRVMVA